MTDAPADVRHTQDGKTGKTLSVKVWRGEGEAEGSYSDYEVPEIEGMVVLDAVHYIQRNLETDLACRWNCKAAKCGSCSAEVNGRPVLMCKTRVDELSEGPITVQPMRTFPVIKDLVTDVSSNYRVNEKIIPFTPDPDEPLPWKIQQRDIERLYEFRKCIECFLCMDVCHILRNHGKLDEYYGPRYFVRTAALEMHPVDIADRVTATKDDGGLGFCNITKCCTDVCPEHIHITDNAIIPMKERVADKHWDPIRMLLRKESRTEKKAEPSA